MSELEIQKRQEYKRRRKRWTLVQLVAIIVLAAMALVSFLIYNRMNRIQYIEYTESGAIDYKVQYNSNDFFDEEWIDKEDLDKVKFSKRAKGNIVSEQEEREI